MLDLQIISSSTPIAIDRRQAVGPDGMADGGHDGVSEPNSTYRQPVSAKQNQLSGCMSAFPESEIDTVDGILPDGKMACRGAVLASDWTLAMLTDIALKKLKPRDKLYKVADRDGMYIAMAPSGQITFRYDYRLNGRRETLTKAGMARTAFRCPKLATDV